MAGGEPKACEAARLPKGPPEPGLLALNGASLPACCPPAMLREASSVRRRLKLPAGTRGSVSLWCCGGLCMGLDCARFGVELQVHSDRTAICAECCSPDLRGWLTSPEPSGRYSHSPSTAPHRAHCRQWSLAGRLLPVLLTARPETCATCQPLRARRRARRAKPGADGPAAHSSRMSAVLRQSKPESVHS